MVYHCGPNDVEWHFCSDKDGTTVGDPILCRHFWDRQADRTLREIIVAHLKANPELSEKALREYFVMVIVGYKSQVTGKFLEFWDRAVLLSPSSRDEQMVESQTATPLE